MVMRMKSTLFTLIMSLLAQAPNSYAQQNLQPPSLAPGTNQPALNVIKPPEKKDWLSSELLLGIAGIWITSMTFYFERRKEVREAKREKFDFIKELMKEVKSQEGVHNVLTILNSTGYRSFSVQLPGTDKPSTFSVTDELLVQSLKVPNEISKIQSGIRTIREDQKELDVKWVDDYEKELFPIEITIKEWFDQFLDSFSEIENSISHGVCVTSDYKPYIGELIQRIFDPEFSLNSSTVNNAIHSYIEKIGYAPFLKLIGRFGYEISSSPYSQNDFSNFSEKSKVGQALALAKACKLVHEDGNYIEATIRLWLKDKFEDPNSLPDDDYVRSIVCKTKEGKDLSHPVESSRSFKYFKAKNGINFIAFRKQDLVVLVFGSSATFTSHTNNQFTNHNVRLVKDGNDIIPAAPHFHQGFLRAWISIEGTVYEQIRELTSEFSHQVDLVVTGHSIGGAIATLAAVFLERNNFKIKGLFTFGQPRVGDVFLMIQANRFLQTNAYRFVNESDIVPRLPPPYLPSNKFACYYAHFGQLNCLDSHGSLNSCTSPWFRLVDFYADYKLYENLMSDILTSKSDTLNIMIKRHRIEAYINSLVKVLNTEMH